MARLSTRRRVFVEEYLTCWNGAEAARRAGYSERTADRQASRLLSLAEIQAYVQQRISEKAMGADEVLLRLTEQARGEIAAYLAADGSVDLEHLLADGKGHLVKGTRRDRQGNLVVEFYDAQAALTLLGRHHRLFSDQVQLSGEVDIDIHDYRAELERRLLEVVESEDDSALSGQPE
ncbi:MAG: terminase small subunit [Anaerolineales bacterium]|nr:terminase small subunit [Anaerolineales bacterium]